MNIEPKDFAFAELYTVVGKTGVVLYRDKVGYVEGYTLVCGCGRQLFFMGLRMPTFCGCGKGYVKDDFEGWLELARKETQ